MTYLAIAIPAVGRYDESLAGILILVIYWCSPFAIIMALEHFVFRRSNFENYNLDSWNTPKELPLGIAAVSAFVIGNLGAVLGMSQAYYVGVAAAAAGSADIGIILGVVFSAVAYLILRPMELYWLKI